MDSGLERNQLELVVISRTFQLYTLPLRARFTANPGLLMSLLYRAHVARRGYVYLVLGHREGVVFTQTCRRRPRFSLSVGRKRGGANEMQLELFDGDDVDNIYMPRDGEKGDPPVAASACLRKHSRRLSLVGVFFWRLIHIHMRALCVAIVGGGEQQQHIHSRLCIHVFEAIITLHTKAPPLTLAGFAACVKHYSRN